MSRIEWRQLRVPVMAYGGLLAVVVGAAAEFGSDPLTHALLASGLLCLFHLIVGYIIIEGSFERSPMSFLKRVLGGMGVRLSLMLVVLFVLLRTGAFDDLWLLLGLLLWYAVALLFEITALQKRVSLKQDHGT